MAQDTRHVASGIAAVIDSAHVTASTDVWVDTVDLPEAVRQVRKLTGESVLKPGVYPGNRDSRICIRLE